MKKKQDLIKEKEKKELINNLLKKLLEHRLIKLEKKNVEEIKEIKVISKEYQSIILKLDDYSQNVRKNVLLNRQKFMADLNPEDNKSKKKVGDSKNKKTSVTDKKNGLKGEKNNLRDENSLFQRKNNRIASKSVSNFKKIHNTSEQSSKTLGLNKSKRAPSNSHLNISKFGKTINIKSPNKIKEETQLIPKPIISPTKKGKDKSKAGKTPRRISLLSEENEDKLNKTDYIKKKDISAIPKNPKGAKKKEDKKKIELKTIDSKNKKEDDYSKSNKNLDLPKPINSEPSLQKVGTIPLEEGLINDELLFESNPSNKNLDSSKPINSEPSLQKVGTIPLEEGLINDELLFVSNPLNINSYLKDDNNDNNKQDNEKIYKNKEKSSIMDTKFGQRIASKLSKEVNKSKIKLSLLSIDKDINLVEEELRLSGQILFNGDFVDKNEDEQLPLQEKFEANLDIIFRYLDNKTIFTLMLVNKECFKTLLNILISKMEISIGLLEEEIKKIKNKNTNINFDNAKISPFKIGVNSSRAVSLLNSSSANGFISLKVDQLNKKEVELIYDIYFIAVGKKKEIVHLTNIQKLEYIKNYFLNYVSKKNLGSFIEKEINGKIFSDDIISSIYHLSYKYINIISPNYYQRINKDFAIFVFIIKDILEHIGLLTRNPKPEKEYIIDNARLESYKLAEEKFNDMYKIID